MNIIKNTNRGLVLGLVLVLCVTGYEIKGNITFKKSKPELEQTTRDYVKEVANANIGSEQQVKDNWNTIIDKYFTEYNDKATGLDIYDGDTSDYRIGNFKNAVNNISFKTGKIDKCTVDISEIEVSKYGANGARVYLEYNICYEYTGYNISTPFIIPDNIFRRYDTDIMPAEELEKLKNTSDKINYSGSATVYYTNTKDGWKIGYIQNLYSTYDEETYDEDIDEEREMQPSEETSEADDKTSVSEADKQESATSQKEAKTNE